MKNVLTVKIVDLTNMRNFISDVFQNGTITIILTKWDTKIPLLKPSSFHHYSSCISHEKRMLVVQIREIRIYGRQVILYKKYASYFMESHKQAEQNEAYID